MITIKPSKGTENIKSYLNLNYDNIVFLKACDGDRFLGAGGATYEGEIKAVKSETPVLNNGIIKSFINFFDRRGIKNIYSFNKTIFDDLKRVGFEKSGNKYVLNTDEFFENPCKHS